MRVSTATVYFSFDIFVEMMNFFFVRKLLTQNNYPKFVFLLE